VAHLTAALALFPSLAYLFRIFKRQSAEGSSRFSSEKQHES
jgi:hypothetical protein